MKNIPQKIYLQVDTESDKPTGDYYDLCEVTWCQDRINNSDLEYHYNPLSQWIPVEAELPPFDTNCIVFDKNSKSVSVGFRTDKISFSINDIPVDSIKQGIWFLYAWDEPREVSHWMPLPADPYFNADATE